jgi:hypothetical protein
MTKKNSPQESLLRHWNTDSADNLIFCGTEEAWEEWKKNWFARVPMCKNFKCAHDSMACGIHRACGDCSTYEFMSTHGGIEICTMVTCSDCLDKATCRKKLKYKTKGEIEAKRGEL